MVDVSRIYHWTWDARPFPAFPAQTEVWADGPNHRTGHWLTGRLGGMAQRRTGRGDRGRAWRDAERRSRRCRLIHGYVLTDVTTGRDALEPVIAATGLRLRDGAGGLELGQARRGAAVALDVDGLAEGEGSLVSRRRGDPAEAAGRLALTFIDRERDYLTGTVTALRGAGPLAGEVLPLVLDLSGARTAAEQGLVARGPERETVEFALPPSALAIEPGDVVSLSGLAEGPFEVTEIRDGLARRVTARTLPAPVTVTTAADQVRSGGGGSFARSLPLLAAAHLPPVPEDAARTRIALAAHAQPWPGFVTIADQATGATLARLTRRGVVGETMEALGPGDGRDLGPGQCADGADLCGASGGAGRGVGAGRGKPAGSRNRRWRVGSGGVRRGGTDCARCLSAEQAVARAGRDSSGDGAGFSRAPGDAGRYADNTVADGCAVAGDDGGAAGLWRGARSGGDRGRGDAGIVPSAAAGAGAFAREAGCGQRGCRHRLDAMQPGRCHSDVVPGVQTRTWSHGQILDLQVGVGGQSGGRVQRRGAVVAEGWVPVRIVLQHGMTHVVVTAKRMVPLPAAPSGSRNENVWLPRLPLCVREVIRVVLPLVLTLKTWMVSEKAALTPPGPVLTSSQPTVTLSPELEPRRWRHGQVLDLQIGIGGQSGGRVQRRGAVVAEGWVPVRVVLQHGMAHVRGHREANGPASCCPLGQPQQERLAAETPTLRVGGDQGGAAIGVDLEDLDGVGEAALDRAGAGVDVVPNRRSHCSPTGVPSLASRPGSGPAGRGREPASRSRPQTLCCCPRPPRGRRCCCRW